MTDFDALAFAQEVLCPQADATDTAKSNMIDLLERLEQLRTAGAIGQHNVAMVSPKGVPYLAVCLNEVWPILSKYGTAPNYGMAAVKGQIEDCGGIIDAKTRQSFVKTKMEWDDFIRADAAWAANDGATHARPKRPSRTSPRACVLIPATVVEQALGVGWDDQVSPSSESEIVQIADYQAKQIDAPELTIGSPAVLLQDTPEGLKRGDRVTVKQIQYDPKAEMDFAAVADSGGKNYPVWINCLRSLTEDERLGPWESAA